jgi:selenocysteine lyase/cysteine desulfurase
VPLVIDFSSHAGSRPMALERAAFGYAGAQKNLGPSGVTLVYIRKDLLAKKPAAHVPVILRYATHAKEPSLYNTPNTFGVLVLKLVLEWMRDEGGLPAIGGGQRAQGGQAVRGARREPGCFAARAAGQPLAHERDVDGQRGAGGRARGAVTSGS